MELPLSGLCRLTALRHRLENERSGRTYVLCDGRPKQRPVALGDQAPTFSHSTGVDRLTFERHTKEMTGLRVNPETWKIGQAANLDLELETVNIATRLERMGWTTQKETGGRMYMIGIATGGVEEIIPWRNSNLLPVIARKNRQRMLKHLTFFTEKNEGVRMMVVTQGRKCSAWDLPKKLITLHRKISKLNHEKITKDLGIEVVFRSTEFTVSKLQADEEGVERECYVHANRIGLCDDRREPHRTEFTTLKGHWFHPHAHVLVRSSKTLSDAEWSYFHTFSEAYFSAKVLPPQRLVDPKEAVKYCFKPGDVMKLYDWELLHIAKELHKIHMTQPLGGFRVLMADLTKRKVKLGKRVTLSGGVVDFQWCEINIRERKAPEGKESDVDQEGNPVEKRTKNPHNALLAITSPMARFGPVMEPCAIVCNLTNVPEFIDQNRMQDMEAWCRMKVSDSGSLLNVHTLPITVRDAGGPEFEFDGVIDEFRPPGRRHSIAATFARLRREHKNSKPEVRKSSEELERQLAGV